MRFQTVTICNQLYGKIYNRNKSCFTIEVFRDYGIHKGNIV